MRIRKTPPHNPGVAIMVALLMLLALPACSIHQEKSANGDDKNVDIDTPVGGIHVGEDVKVEDTGLPVYPGARLKPKKDHDDDENSANVNISSGFFGLKVVAIDYETDDDPGKVAAFYRDKLKKFGNVIECHSSGHGHNYNVHASKDGDSKSRELKCEGDNSGSNIELKVGTEQNQHLVSLEPQGKGTEFGLVFIQMHGKDTI